ncbi:MAG: sortase [bacterium]|nr:sortase [bacterium]
MRAASFLIILGLLALASALTLFFFTFYPVFLNEANYLFKRPQAKSLVLKSDEEKPAGKTVIVAQDEEFGIVIPKIGANAKVLENVNPLDSQEYQRALTKGVAHAKGTATPGKNGNIFIFSHSSANFYEAGRYNSIFYLLNKMEKGDEIYLFYKKKKYKYLVTEKKTVDPKDISYLSPQSDKKQLTLMTCWPPGTTFKRLLVIGELVEENP